MRTYLAITTTLTVLILACVAALNYFVDPYRIHNSSISPWSNTAKPQAGKLSRVSKAINAERGDWATLVVGNSRPEIGFNPDSPCWPKNFLPVFNLGIPGASAYQQFRYAQHAIHHNTIKQMLVTIDLVDYLKPPSAQYAWGSRPFAFDSRLSVSADGKAMDTTWARSKEIAESLISLDATLDTLSTLALTSQADLTAAGFNPALEHVGIIQAEGVATLFAQKDRSVAGTFARKNMTIPERSSPGPFQHLDHFLGMATDAGISVTLVINPLHSRYLERLDIESQSVSMSTFKAEAAKLAQDHSVPLWDFAQRNDQTQEPLPEGNANYSPMRWFWEQAHYRQEYGDQILATIYPGQCQATPGLGEQLAGGEPPAN